MLFMFHQFYRGKEFCSVELIDQDTVIDLILTAQMTQVQHPELSFKIKVMDQ